MISEPPRLLSFSSFILRTGTPPTRWQQGVEGKTSKYVPVMRSGLPQAVTWILAYFLRGWPKIKRPYHRSSTESGGHPLGLFWESLFWLPIQDACLGTPACLGQSSGVMDWSGGRSEHTTYWPQRNETDYICKICSAKKFEFGRLSFKTGKDIDASTSWYSNRQWIIPETNIRLWGFRAPSNKETSQYPIRRNGGNDRFNWIWLREFGW